MDVCVVRCTVKIKKETRNRNKERTIKEIQKKNPERADRPILALHQRIVHPGSGTPSASYSKGTGFFTKCKETKK